MVVARVIITGTETMAVQYHRPLPPHHAQVDWNSQIYPYSPQSGRRGPQANAVRVSHTAYRAAAML